MGTARKTLIPFPLAGDLTGKSVGRFVIHSKLGSGGMGEIYYAEDPILRRPVALKRVTHKLGSDPGARKEILGEAQRASVLSSEHIAAVYDVLEEAGELFLVMEYVEGETLRQRLLRPLALEDFFTIATQSAEALAAAHEHGIIHCDIKPENIMLTPSGQVKVLDFGLSKHLPRSDRSSTLDSRVFGGTPSYMAPEVLLQKLPDSRSDIFSLGVVLYEALTRKNPFFTGSFVGTSERILHDNPASIRKFNSAVPEALEVVVNRAMAKNTAERYATANEMLSDLRRVQTGKLPAHGNPSLSVRKKRTILCVVAALLVITIVVAAFHWMHRTPLLAERGWVLVSDFSGSTAEDIPEEGVREGLTIALQQSRYLNVFPRSRAYETLQRMKKPGEPRIDETLGREICQRENLQVLLAGSIEHVGETFQISVRGLDPVRGSALFAERERFDRKEMFFDRVDSLARKVRKDLGESLIGIKKNSRGLADVTTSSLEALQLYSQAEDAKDRGNDEQLPVLLQGALRLDPDFAMAHMRLSEYYSAVIGRNEKALAEVQRAYQLRQEVTDRERRKIEAAFFSLQERYDDKAESLRVLVSLYPDDEEGHQRLAMAYYDLGQLENAITEVHEAIRLNPFSAPAFANLVLYSARQNRFDAAIAAAREAEQKNIASPRMHWGLGLAYLGQRNFITARQEFQRIGNATEVDQDLQQLCFALADLYEGKLESARLELTKQVETSHAQGQGLQAFRRYLLGRIYLSQNKAGAAERQADFTLRTASNTLPGNSVSDAGTLYARAGNLAKAKQALRTLDELQSADPSSENQDNFHILEGEILLAEAKPQEAEIAFSMAAQSFCPYMSSIGLARAYEAEKHWELSLREWEKVLAEQGAMLQNGFPPDLAIAHLQLARLYRRMNNRNAARNHYEEVLRLWQHGEEVTLLRDAQREFKGLAPEAGPSESGDPVGH